MLLDGIKTLLQIGHFRFQCSVALTQFNILLALLLNFLVQTSDILQAAVANPQLVLQIKQQPDQQ